MPCTVDSSSITELDKQLNTLGIPYFEISNYGTDTLDFIYRVNLHIIINTGKIIYLK